MKNYFISKRTKNPKFNTIRKEKITFSLKCDVDFLLTQGLHTAICVCVRRFKSVPYKTTLRNVKTQTW